MSTSPESSAAPVDSPEFPVMGRVRFTVVLLLSFLLAALFRRRCVPEDELRARIADTDPERRRHAALALFVAGELLQDIAVAIEPAPDGR